MTHENGFSKSIQRSNFRLKARIITLFSKEDKKKQIHTHTRAIRQTGNLAKEEKLHC